MSSKIIQRAAFIMLLILGFSGCGMMGDVKDPSKLGAEELYQSAHQDLLDANYSSAIASFQMLEGRYPYGRLAQQSMLESAYASYRIQDVAGATAGTDRFIRTYPNHPNVEYAYYLKGLANFREDTGLFGYVVDLDLSERDPKAIKDALDVFKELVTRFPNSRYAPDANDRIRYLTNALAMHEVHVARYYFNRGAYIAAANRAQGSLVNHPRTPANEDALALLVRSYDKLGMTQLRDDSQRILEKNFPKSKYVVGELNKPWWKLW